MVASDIERTLQVCMAFGYNTSAVAMGNAVGKMLGNRPCLKRILRDSNTRPFDKGNEGIDSSIVAMKIQLIQSRHLYYIVRSGEMMTWHSGIVDVVLQIFVVL